MAEVETTRDGAVLTIALNRPDKLNAFDAAMHKAFAGALKEAAGPEVRAVVLTGAGRGFCVGQDLAELSEGERDIGGLLRARWNRHVLGLRGLDKPVLAAVNGAAAGAGLSLACACDLRVAADSAVFVPAFVSVGLVPDTGGSWLVPQLLGYARAFEWMCSGRKIGAHEALAWGLVAEVVPGEGALPKAQERAAALATLPTRAIAMTKRLFAQASRSRLEDQLELEAQLQVAATRTDDFAEGVAAFLEKREPRFTGT
ncbi:MAG TPA: enoyl-CoA hydratase-related protein [Gaiellaceae bacterium]|nr:enoyl-CoA hydratase-related protein [Gaiellaceae bacterium]